ncbi:MAG: KH domain-containing protein [Candidatus Diapherotrites archaeon]|nr:KH domain-containing protein [Candidatus Diapherotrites archaeon]
MKGPICFEDIKNNRLCKICEAKLKAGIVTENDLAICRELVRLAEKSFLDLEFIRSFEINGTLAIVCKGNIGALIGKAGKNIQALEKKLGKKIRVVEKTNDDKQTAQSMLGRIQILALNKVFKPEGEEIKIMVSKKDFPRIPDKEQTQKALSKIIGKPVEIEAQ